MLGLGLIQSLQDFPAKTKVFPHPTMSQAVETRVNSAPGCQPPLQVPIFDVSTGQQPHRGAGATNLENGFIV